MAKIRVKSAIDVFNLGRVIISDAKEEILTTIAKEAVNRITSKSNGRIVPEIEYGPNKVIIVAIPTPDDPTGEKLRKAEAETRAFELSYKELSNKATVVSIINKKK